MKSFFSALTLSIAVSGLVFLRLNFVETCPEVVRSALISGVDRYLAVLREIYQWSEIELLGPMSAEVKAGVAGGVAFLGLWIIFALLFGLRGFCRDFFAFFPLRA